MSLQMNRKTLRNLLILVPFTIAVGSCANGGLMQADATHFWQAETVKTERDYKRDQSKCAQTHRVEPDEAMPADSLSFERYRTCMIEKGYVLRTY